MLKKLFLIFKVVVIVNLLICLVNGKWTATFICLFNLILFFIDDYVQKKLFYSDFFKLLIYLFLIVSLLGGEVYYLYSKIWYLDIFLHVLSSFIVSGLFLCLFKTLVCYVKSYNLIVCIFSFAMMVAAMWEIAEFSIDRVFNVDMQKDTVVSEINSVLLSNDGKTIINKKINSMRIGEYNVDGYLDIGLYDTISDMICAVVGSIIFIIMYKLKGASLI